MCRAIIGARCATPIPSVRPAMRRGHLATTRTTSGAAGMAFRRAWTVVGARRATGRTFAPAATSTRAQCPTPADGLRREIDIAFSAIFRFPDNRASSVTRLIRVTRQMRRRRRMTQCIARPEPSNAEPATPQTSRILIPARIAAGVMGSWRGQLTHRTILTYDPSQAEAS